jgi:hypothetical protein
MVIIIVGYFMFLSANWLSVTIMYILKKEITFTALITAGIAMVFVMFIIIKLDIIVSQIIALFCFYIRNNTCLIFLCKSRKKIGKGISPPLPRKSIMIYSVMPFFDMVVLYFTFLFCDRVVAWSRNDVYMPYLIWFRGAYELGLEFALLMLILQWGLVRL